MGNRGAQRDPEGMLRKCWRSGGALGVPGVFGGMAAGGGGLEGLIGVWGGALGWGVWRGYWFWGLG